MQISKESGDSSAGEPTSGAGAPRPAELVLGGSRTHVYRGKKIELDLGALRQKALLPPLGEERRLADEYRTVKRPLIAHAIGRGGRKISRGNLILVASALSGEGKTFTSFNLALSLALEKDWTVMLVDGDVAKPTLTRELRLVGEPGLMDLLRDPALHLDHCVCPTSVERLAFMPAGRADDHAAELLSSGRMETLAAYLADSDPNRLVVIDSPPLLLTSEAPILATHAGQVLVVVQAGKTAQQRVVQAVAKLDPAQAISLVLNQADLGEEALAYGSYGSYGRYHDRGLGA